MSVDVKVYLNKEITPEMVLEVIKLNIDKRASLENENRLKNMSLYNLYLTLEDRKRSIFMMYSNEKVKNTCYNGKEEYLYLSMESDEDSISLMNKIVSIFGGYIDENDCDNIEAQFVECDGVYKKYIQLAEETKIKAAIKDIEDICNKHGLKAIIENKDIKIKLPNLYK
ncbi:hypothetical protein FKF97_10470 [Clostridium perfringens]|nr:hypothetical protein [Clostridium perfringens]